jgi:transcriptional regulator with XRE-family HTH domain
MSQEAFGKRLGVTGAGISKIESGDRSVTDQMVLSVCREFNVRENWLRFGEGEIFCRSYPEAIEEVVRQYHLDELDKRIIYEYVSLDQVKRNVIKEYIRRLSGEYGSIEYDDNAGENGDIPLCAE